MESKQQWSQYKPQESFEASRSLDIAFSSYFRTALLQEVIVQKSQKVWTVGVTPRLLKTELSQEPPCQISIFVPCKLATVGPEKQLHSTSQNYCETRNTAQEQCYYRSF
ncbi:hypothetical protein WISP_117725 [Willisornis vidua]|uniref:Uncharacterized protein n=1 Tax=Willisornis vidua TaxID=1566151 RepID=A0ABQ9CUF5_9PASS|nr:hypothetical protein WISP_117725 [Willisornis vidua]